MSLLGNLIIRLTADTADAVSDMGKAAHQIEREMRQMAIEANAAGSFINDQLQDIGRRFYNLSKDALLFGDQLNKMSQRTGFSVERLSEIAFAGDLADTSIGNISAGLSQFNKNLVEAGREGGKAQQMFEALGVSITDGPQAAFEQMARAINSLPDGEVKAAAMRAAFGKTGDSLIPLMSGLDEATEKANKLGLVISKQMAEDSERFNDAMTTLGTTGKSLAINVLQPLAGWLAVVSENMVAAKINGNSLTVAILEMGKTWAALWGGMAEKVGAGRLAAVMQSEFNRIDQAVKDLTLPGNGAAGNGSTPPQAPTVNEEKLRAALSRSGAARGGKTKGGKDDNLAGRQWQEWMDEEAKIMAEAAAATDKYNQTLRDMEAAETAAMIAGEVARAEAILQMDEILNKQTLMANGFDENGKKIGESAKKNSEWARELGLSFTSAFEDAVLAGKKFSDVLRSLAQDIARIALRKAVTEPLAAAVGKGIEGMFKADGGPVTAGSTYIVGERGPEVFVPSVSGSIVPNHALGGGGVTVVQNINIDSRSDQASIMQAMAMAGERAKNDIMASLNRGGEFARATGRA